jgi:hypothetical protein
LENYVLVRKDSRQRSGLPFSGTEIKIDKSITIHVGLIGADIKRGSTKLTVLSLA